MYKRRRRRTGNAGPKKGKKSTPSSPPPTETEEVNMSVSTMDSGTESHLNYGHGHQLRQPLPDSTMNIQNHMVNHAGGKAVGARKRKPTQISKIVDKPSCSENENEQSDETGSGNEVTETQEEDLVSTNNNNNVNNNNSPPYKKPCLLQVESKKNGMIRNIVTELKSAKEASSKLDLYLNLQQAPVGHASDTNSEDDTDSHHLHIEEDGDDEEDEEQSEPQQPTRRRQKGNEVAKVVGSVRQRSSSTSSPNQTQKKRKTHNLENNNSLLLSRNSRNGGEKVDLANVKTLLSHNHGSTNHTYQAQSTKDLNGWARDEEEEDEGIDLRNVLAGNVIVDEDDAELRFRCGGCPYSSSDKNVLLRHMKTHKGERPFQCRLCFFAFTTKANCERHLRNRHGQIDKDQVRNLVVCISSSSNASESEPETKSRENNNSPLLTIPITKNVNSTSGGGLVLQQPPKQKMVGGLAQQQNMDLLDFSSTGPAGFGLGLSIPVPQDDLPLDLSMDAVDLSIKNRPTAFARPNNSLLRPRPLYPSSDGSNLLVTSPYISKREPMVHPQLPIPMLSTEGHYNGMFLGANGYSPFSHPIRSTDLNGTATPIPQPFSALFPFGGQSHYNPFNLPVPTPNMEKLMSLNRPKSPPSKLTSGFMSCSPSTSFGSRESMTNSAEKEVKIEKSGLKQSRASEAKSSSVSSGSPSTSSRKRGDPKNGEYQKPKQRRYRTERPFACPHCPARFTLRSNMERHGKHQHPTVWQRSPSNRVINRQQKNQQSPLVGPPTLVHPNKYSGTNGMEDLDYKPSKGSRATATNTNVDGMSNVDVRAVIAQQLKRKLSNSNIRKSLLNGGGAESGTETESDTNTFNYSEGKSGPESSDLASVSQLLDRVKNSNIAQYFHEPGSSKSVHTESEEEERSCGGGESSDEGGETEEGTEPEESKDQVPSSSSAREKKKSAYSSAPHKISCPHCSRRFPWTSSLRRHLLTHTGQKPYQCSSCPLLFTTKSNCDRHLARKHNGKVMKSGNNSTDEEEEEDGCEADEDRDEQDEQHFEDNPAADSEAVTPTTGQPSSKASSPNEDVAFRCHLCEASAGEREVLLTHMEEDHKETFQVLISKGALTSSPPSENSEAEQIPLDHKEKEASHRKVVCVFCVRRFWSVEDLRRHIRSHSGERPFSCPHCSRRFTLKHSMLRHLKKHASEDSQETPKSRRDKHAGSSDKAAKLTTKLVTEGEGNSVNSDDTESDLIGRLLGINDESLVEQLLNKPDAKDAAKLLGLRMGLARHHTSVTASTT